MSHEVTRCEICTILNYVIPFTYKHNIIGVSSCVKPHFTSWVRLKSSWRLLVAIHPKDKSLLRKSQHISTYATRLDGLGFRERVVVRDVLWDSNTQAYRVAKSLRVNPGFISNQSSNASVCKINLLKYLPKTTLSKAYGRLQQFRVEMNPLLSASQLRTLKLNGCYYA
jgi:hypothetical protein